MESVVGRLAAVVLPYARRAGHWELQAVVIGHLGCQFAQAIEYSRCRRLLVLILYTDAFTKDSEQQMESTMALTICEKKVPSSELISQLTSF